LREKIQFDADTFIWSQRIKKVQKCEKFAHKMGGGGDKKATKIPKKKFSLKIIFFPSD